MLPAGAAMRLVLPSGAEMYLGAPGVRPITLHVNDARMFQRVVLRSDIGLGEA